MYCRQLRLTHEYDGHSIAFSPTELQTCAIIQQNLGASKRLPVERCFQVNTISTDEHIPYDFCFKRTIKLPLPHWCSITSYKSFPTYHYEFICSRIHNRSIRFSCYVCWPREKTENITNCLEQQTEQLRGQCEMINNNKSISTFPLRSHELSFAFVMQSGLRMDRIIISLCFVGGRSGGFDERTNIIILTQAMHVAHLKKGTTNGMP